MHRLWDQGTRDSQPLYIVFSMTQCTHPSPLTIIDVIMVPITELLVKGMTKQSLDEKTFCINDLDDGKCCITVLTFYDVKTW
jgi:hypothetical protein